MAKKDKFAQMQQGGGVSSFQESLVQAATTVAAIERQQEEQAVKQQPSKLAAVPSRSSTGTSATVTPASTTVPGGSDPGINLHEPPRFMRLPNPQIPMQEYSMVSSYCSKFANMTRQDFVELAIIEKLHKDGCMTQEDFDARHKEITSRPPRGQRKGTKQTIKQAST